jgi:kynureninase
MLTKTLIEMLKSKPNVHILTPLKNENRSGILTFSRESPQSADDTVRSLSDQQIIISAREGLFRIAPHFYNTTDELEQTINRLFKR